MAGEFMQTPIIDSVNANKQKLDRVMIEFETQKKQQEKIREKVTELVELEQDGNEEAAMMKKSLVFLKNWYANSKEEKINALQEDINGVLNQFFSNKYNLKLKTRVVRNKDTLELVDVNNKGEEIKAMKLILSNAEQQMVGFLVQVTTLGNLESSVLFLDEAFSSLGVEEVKIIPDLLEALGDTQLIIIEHKEELFEDTDYPTIELESIDGITHIKGRSGFND